MLDYKEQQRRSNRDHKPVTKHLNTCLEEAILWRCILWDECNPEWKWVRCFIITDSHIIHFENKYSYIVICMYFFTYINENGVNVIGAVISLEWGDIWAKVVSWRISKLLNHRIRNNFSHFSSKIICLHKYYQLEDWLTWYDEYVSIFISIICPMSSSTITNGETRCLIANQLQI